MLLHFVSDARSWSESKPVTFVTTKYVEHRRINTLSYTQTQTQVHANRHARVRTHAWNLTRTGTYKENNEAKTAVWNRSQQSTAENTAVNSGN